MDILKRAHDNLEGKTKAEIRNLCAQFNIPIESATVSSSVFSRSPNTSEDMLVLRDRLFFSFHLEHLINPFAYPFSGQ